MSRKLGLFENMTIIVAMVLLDLFVAAPATTAAARKCPAGQFLPPDSLLNECRRCSSCPDNEIIRKPCSEERDTECGPFYEFRDFNSFQPGEAELDIGVGQYPKNSATGSPKPEDLKNEFSEDSTFEDGISAKGQKAPSVQTSQEHWKELCCGLIAALVIVTLCAVLYIVTSQVLRRRRLRKNASPLHNDTDVTVYYRTDGHAEEHHQYPHHSRYQPSTRVYKPSLVHIESQLEHNQRYRRFWQRFLRPGSAQILGGNEYVVTGDNLHNQEMQDQRRLLPMNIVPEDNAQIPLAHVHQEDNLPLPEGAGGANISLHSTDSGIVAGLGDHPHTSHA